MIKVDFGLGMDFQTYPSLETALLRREISASAPSSLTASDACLQRICRALRALPAPETCKPNQSFTWRGNFAAVVWDNLALIVAETDGEVR